MYPVLQMYLEIIDSRLRPWRIQLARTIQTLYSWVIHVLRVRGRRLVRACVDGQVGNGRNGGVAHCALEEIIGVSLLELGECVT